MKQIYYFEFLLDPDKWMSDALHLGGLKVVDNNEHVKFIVSVPNEDEYLDKDGYPTQRLLSEISSFDIVKGDVNELINLVLDHWIYDDYYKLEENTLELHTGGWSGNEDIIGALKQNTLFWTLYWNKSERGGHYYFDLSKIIKEKK